MSFSHQDNSDPAEIRKFTQMANQWWDTKGPCKLLHKVNPLRLQFIKEQLLSLQDKKIIDIGCGGGILTEALAKTGAQVTGIDKSDALIRIANQHAQKNCQNIYYLVNDAETLARYQRELFDAVCCMELLEHVPDPSRLIKACSELTKPKGWLFFSTIHRNLRSYLMAIIGAEYLFKLLPQGTHDYKRFIRPSELVRIARQLGLSLQKLQGIYYNPLTQQCHLTQNIQVNYLVSFQKRV